jgi:hypothetical protein
MHFRQSGQRAERRRRVLMEEATQGADASTARPPSEAAPSKAPAAVGNYDAQTLDECRYRLTDLIPTRLWSLSVLGLTVLALIAGVQALYGGVLLDPRVELPPRAGSVLDVSVSGSLASWLAAMLLAVAAAGGWLLFVLRRHRKDDYRGHYRIWIWAGGGLLFASVDAGTGLHTIFAVLLTRLAGTPLFGTGDVWWVGLYSLVFGSLAIRMLVEIRRSRLATFSLLATGVCYALAACVWLSVIPLDGGTLQKMLGSSLSLLAAACLLGTVVVYARYVYLDAQGKLNCGKPRSAGRGTRKSRTKRDDSTSASRASRSERAGISSRRGRRERVDEGHAGQSTARRRKSGKGEERPETDDREAVTADAAPAAQEKREAAASRDASQERRAASGDGEGTSSDDGDTAGLSKAERRKLRKQRRRQKQVDGD